MKKTFITRKKFVVIFVLFVLMFALLFNPIVSASNMQPIPCRNPYKSLPLSYVSKVMLLSKIKFSQSFKKAVELSKEEGYTVDYEHPLFKASSVNNQVIYVVEFPLNPSNNSTINFIGISTTKSFSKVKVYLFTGTVGSNYDKISVTNVASKANTTLIYKHRTNKLVKVVEDGTIVFSNSGSTLTPSSTGGWCAACIGCEAGCDALTGGILFFECIGACYMACRYPCEKCGW